LFNNLSEREREVLVLLAQGKTYQQIAEILFISPKTVDFHRSNLMRKLGLSSRADLTKFALQHGLIS
jgi:DNA-binding CsgD family transcriptional regulator